MTLCPECTAEGLGTCQSPAMCRLTENRKRKPVWPSSRTPSEQKGFSLADLYRNADGTVGEAAFVTVRYESGCPVEIYGLPDHAQDFHDSVVQERADLRRLVQLLDEQRAATGWGAAVGQREEEIAGLRRKLGV